MKGWYYWLLMWIWMAGCKPHPVQPETSFQDEETHEHAQLKDSIRWYGHLGDIYKSKQMPDSAIHYYTRAYEMGTDTELFKYAVHITELLAEVKDSDFAWSYLKKLRQAMQREDVPFVNLIEGDIRMQLHQPDSAMKHYQIVADSKDKLLANLAFERMGKWLEENGEREKAFSMYHKSVDTRTDLLRNVLIQRDQNDYIVLKQKNQLNELKMERQHHIILILGMSVFIILLAGCWVTYYFHRKNQLLKQQEELNSLRTQEAMLREKDALMREELLQRIHVQEKLQSDGHIRLSDADWKDIRLMLDSTYPDFTQKLLKQFPTLTEKDINFCCLVKINMSLQSLSDIYCISGNSVSRRKLRLKEKLGIDKDDSLTKFLGRFT